MHSTLLRSSPTKHTFVSEHHGPLQPLSLRDMEAKQLKSIKSYPEAVGRSLTTATGTDSCGYRAGSAEMEMEAKIQKAIDFKAEGHRCYKEKKFREAIGKYHRALLQLKGMQVVDGTTGSEVNLLNQAASKLTEEQRRAVESTEIECYDSLTGEQRRQDAPPAAQEPQGLLQFIGFTLQWCVILQTRGLWSGGRRNNAAGASISSKNRYWHQRRQDKSGKCIPAS